MKIEDVLLTCLEKGRVEAGCDEAGRGCLAGPVFAAAVILPDDFHCDGLTHSKKLTPKEREKLRINIEKEAICYYVEACTPEEIDELIYSGHRYMPCTRHWETQHSARAYLSGWQPLPCVQEHPPRVSSRAIPVSPSRLHRYWLKRIVTSICNNFMWNTQPTIGPAIRDTPPAHKEAISSMASPRITAPVLIL